MAEPLLFDHYRVLGVTRDATAKEIKRAYRERVKLCHPDRNASPQAATMFHAVHKAYEALHDAERRAAYDQGVRYKAHTNAPPRPAQPRPTRRTIHVDEERDVPMNRFAFFGLHATGLCFSLALIGGILVGVTFFAWPYYTLVLCIPGMVVLPDSWTGLRMK